MDFTRCIKKRIDNGRFRDLMGEILWVLRYIGCTVCRYDVHVLTERYNEFVEKGVNVVVVMQSKPEIVQRDLAGGTLPFHLICDEAQEIYKTLEINAAKDMAELLGDGMAKLQEKGAKAAGWGRKSLTIP